MGSEVGGRHYGRYGRFLLPITYFTLLCIGRTINRQEININLDELDKDFSNALQKIWKKTRMCPEIPSSSRPILIKLRLLDSSESM